MGELLARGRERRQEVGRVLGVNTIITIVTIIFVINIITITIPVTSLISPSLCHPTSMKDIKSARPLLMGAVCCNQQGQVFEEISEVERAGAGKGGRGQTPSPGGDAIMMMVVVIVEMVVMRS